MGFLSIFDSLLPMPKDGEPGPAGENAQMYVLTITSAVLRVLPTSGGERLIEEYIAGKLEFVNGSVRIPVNLASRTDIYIRLSFDNNTESYNITGVDGYGVRNTDGTWNDAGLFSDSAYGGDTIGKPKYIRVWVWRRDADDSIITLAETTVPVIVEGEKGTNGDDAVTYSILTDRDTIRTVDEDVQIRILITQGKTVKDVSLYTAKQSYGLTMTALLGNNEISHLVEASDDMDSQIYGFTPKLGQTLDMKLWKSNQLVARKTLPVTSDGILGKLVYPAGIYNVSTTYTATTKSTPMVEENGLYYYLAITGSVKGISPSEDVAAKGGNWELMDSFKAVFTDILMANFAKLASAIFSGDYMFSQYGIDSDGNVSKEYQKLAAGTFTPNLLIDFLRGSLKTNKLSEVFTPFRNVNNPLVTYCDALSLSHSYNIITEGLSVQLLCMPLLSDITSLDGEVLVAAEEIPNTGVHSMVVVNPSIAYESAIAYSLRKYAADATWEGDNNGYTWNTILGRCLLLCADPRIFNKYSYRILSGYPDGSFAPRGIREMDDFNLSHVEDVVPDMFFVVNGIFSKFLILEPGAHVRLRSCKIASTSGGELDCNVWVVENSSDFEQLDIDISIGVKYQYSELTKNLVQQSKVFKRYGRIGEGNNFDADSQYGDTSGWPYVGRLFGSKRLRRFYDLCKKTGWIFVGLSSTAKDLYIDEVENVSNYTPYK